MFGRFVSEGAPYLLPTVIPMLAALCGLWTLDPDFVIN